MTPLQSKLLELFKVFKKVCEDNNLTYYLCAGTCLGAIRHKGFIPWDDDLDVCMPRKDYEKLLSLKDAFTGKYFLQTYKTDPHYIFNFAKLRDSSTTYIQDQFYNVRQNHGIWIDIFPLDGYSLKRKDPKKLAPKIRWNWHHNYFMRAYMYRRKIHKETFLKDLFLNIYAYLFFWTNIFHYRNKFVDHMAKSVPFDKAEQVGNLFGAYVHREVMDKDVFEGEPLKVTFEGISANVPPKYDKYLTTMYGDYMTPPPPEKRVGIHISKGFSVDIGFEEYLKKHKI